MNTIPEALRSILPFDPLDPSFKYDPHKHYDQLRRTARIKRISPTHWIITGYEECTEILKGPYFGLGPDPIVSAVTRAVPGGLMDPALYICDPPRHTRLRRLVGSSLQTQLKTGFRPRVEERAGQLTAAFPRQEFDLVSAFTEPLSLAVLCEISGIPAAKHEEFGQLCKAILSNRNGEEARFAALTALTDWTQATLTLRRSKPSRDLISVLARAGGTGEELDDPEIVANFLMLVFAVVEPLGYFLANSALALLRNPAQLALLCRNPDVHEAAVDELLRYDAPLHMTFRYALEDVTTAGQHFRRGDHAVAVVAAANHDPLAFDQPEQLDIARPRKKNLAFGQGSHYCLGAQVVRSAAQAALAALSRTPLELAGQPRVRWNLFSRGVTHLPVAPGRA